MGTYILDGHTPVAEPDVLKWSRQFESQDRRVVLTEIGNITVSTVFLALDHNYFKKGPPSLFETMVHRNGHWDDLERYGTWDEAVEGHNRMVKKIKREKLQTIFPVLAVLLIVAGIAYTIYLCPSC